MAKTLNVAGSVTPDMETVHISKSMKELAKEKLQEFMKEEMKPVKGVFKCFESPGGTVKIIVKKYPGTQPFEKMMTDGEMYEVPLYVARHLNGTDVTAGALSDLAVKNVKIGTCSYPVHAFAWKNGATAPGCGFDGVGVPIPVTGISKRVQRYGFQSLEFAGSAA